MVTTLASLRGGSDYDSSARGDREYTSVMQRWRRKMVGKFEKIFRDITNLHSQMPSRLNIRERHADGLMALLKAIKWREKEIEYLTAYDRDFLRTRYEL